MLMYRTSSGDISRVDIANDSTDDMTSRATLQVDRRKRGTDGDIRRHLAEDLPVLRYRRKMLRVWSESRNLVSLP